MRSPGHVAWSLLPERLESEDYLVIAAVWTLPWAFGGVEIWAYRSASLLLASAAAVSLFKYGWAGLGLDRKARWLLPALLLGVWAGFQLVPLPSALIRVMSPRADALYADTFPGYGGAAPEEMLAAVEQRVLGSAPEFDGLPLPERAGPLSFDAELDGRWTGWRPLSLLPSAGVERLTWYTALLLGFLVVRRRCADETISRLYRGAIFGLFLALAVFGLIYAATSNGKLYWVRETLELTRPFGPYVNPTNFAGVMELAVPWLAGYVWLNLRISRGMPLGRLRSPLFAAAAVLCFVAALAAASKSSAILIGGSLLVLSLVSTRGILKRLAVLGGAGALVAAAVPLLGRTLLGTRFQQFVDMTGGQFGEVGRVVGWKAATGLVRDFLVVGTGFGSFRDVFPRYMPPGESARWAQLHNDYFEILIEGGLVGIVLLAWLTVVFWARVLRRRALTTRGRVNPEAVGLVLGLLALTIHASFDFNHQIPANALLFVILAGMAVVRGEPDENAGAAMPSRQRRDALSLLLATLLVGLFGVRAAVGWWGGPAYAEGRRLAAQGRYEEALPLLVRGSVGPNRSSMLWLAGQVRIGLWQYGLETGGDPESLKHYIEDAHREYTRAITMSPASGWYWLSLGELHHQVERLERFREGLNLNMLELNSWRWVGKPGRLAIGMSRMAIEREPNVFLFHDQLAFTLWDYRLRSTALEAVARSAQVLPVYRFHAYTNLSPVPNEIVDTFAQASRASLGQTPFLRRTLHLLALGRLEFRRGNLDQAERDLRAALEGPGERLNRAEGRYYLGLTLAATGRPAEADEILVLAEEHPNFTASAVIARAGIAEADGRWADALLLLQQARRLKPRDLSYVLEYARVAVAAGEWKKAEEGLRWGLILDGDDPRLWKRLVRVYLEQKRLPAARRAVDEIRRLEGDSPTVLRLSAEIEHVSR